MKRKIYSQLLDWKNKSEGRSALLIQGARRVGKSYIATEFARNEYDDYIIIDFSVVSEEILDLFEHYRHDIDTLLTRVQLYYGKSLPRRRSLIIMDEIQFCSKARSAIKQLVADRRFDYIATGSLISIRRNVKDILIPSEEHSIEMYPMDFEEFLWAKENSMLYDFIRECYAKRQPMGAAIHRKAMDLFREYMVVGGMPQAVLTLIEGGSYEEVEKVKENIITLYRNDIEKYANGEGTRVKAIFDEIPGQLQRHEKKFRLSDISKSARMREYSEAFFWLADARLVNCCYNSAAPNIGLRLNEDRTTLKCYLADTGLLLSLAFSERSGELHEIYKKLILGKMEVNQGMLLENMVAQMFTAAGHKLYFYSRVDREDASNTMEIDFLIAKSRLTSRHNIIPVEVKSGKRYTLNSIRKFYDKYFSFLGEAVVLHDKDLQKESNILYIPTYMAGLL